MYDGERESREMLRQTYMMQGYSYEDAGQRVHKDMGPDSDSIALFLCVVVLAVVSILMILVSL